MTIMGQWIDRRIVLGGHALTGWDGLGRGERGGDRSVTLDGRWCVVASALRRWDV